MRSLVVVASMLASCTTSHPAFEALDDCTSCARGDVASGAVVHSHSITWGARPGGGWIRVDGHHIAWADAAFRIEHEVDVDLDGELDVLAVGPDDTVYIAAAIVDDIDPSAELAAVRPDGSLRWRSGRRAAGESEVVRMAATSDALFVYGALEGDVYLGDSDLGGLFVVRLDPATGAREWMWQTPSLGPVLDGADLAFEPRADGTLVIAGTVEPRDDTNTLDFGGLTLDLHPVRTTTGFVGVLDASGHGLWARSFARGERTTVHRAGLLADGGIAITGTFVGAPLDLGNGVVVANDDTLGANQFVAALEPDGSARWATGLGDGLTEPIESLATLGGAVLVAGTYFGSPLRFGDSVRPPGEDGFIASVTNGALDWVTEAHGPGYLNASVVAREGGVDAVVDNGHIGGHQRLEVGRVYVEGDVTLFANLVP
jgi:hypothetical protein